MDLSQDGFFLDLWRENRRGERVYPCLVTPRGTSEGSLYVTITTKRDDYKPMSLEDFLDHFAQGDFDEVGRIRMKPRSGGSAGGFAIRDTSMSDRLREYLRKARGNRAHTSTPPIH